MFPQAPIFLYGDFNFPEISWPLLTTTHSSPHSESKEFIKLILDFNLNQMITSPTRGDNTLDFLLTSCPDNVQSVMFLEAWATTILYIFAFHCHYVKDHHQKSLSAITGKEILRRVTGS